MCTNSDFIIYIFMNKNQMFHLHSLIIHIIYLIAQFDILRIRTTVNLLKTQSSEFFFRQSIIKKYAWLDSLVPGLCLLQINCVNVDIFMFLVAERWASGTVELQNGYIWCCLFVVWKIHQIISLFFVYPVKLNILNHTWFL